MKRSIVTAALAMVAIAFAPARADTLVYSGTLLAKPGSPPDANQTIIVAKDRIKAVRPGFISPKKGDRVIDLRNRFVLPGLFDCHVHLLGQFGPAEKLERVTESTAMVALRGASHAAATLRAGFTTVRDVGEIAGAGDAIFALRDAIAKDYVPGPRIIAAGAIVSPTGGHGQTYGYREDVLEVFASKGICDGPIECRAATRRQVARGADVIKLVATGGVLSDISAGTGQQFYDDELEAIVKTAHMLGRKVAAHAHGTDGANAALRAGVDSIEHGTFMTNESFRLLRQSGAYYVPTVLAGVTVGESAKRGNWMSPAMRAKALAVGPQILQTLQRAHQAGVKLAFGTDTGVSRHGMNAREFELWAQAGVPAMEAIKAATLSAADLTGMSKDLGTIEAGKYADLIATAGSPLEKISELRQVRFVMKAGTVYKQQ
ncbi:MAG: amidohydrolase family protein [Alphaproteobacteria bacterium]